MKRAMARPAEPIAEKNPFLTGTDLAPATSLSEKFGLSPGTRYDLKDNQDNEEPSEGSELSEVPSESEQEVDEAILEDMAKLENTFDEIGLKFRMMDRIGEGKKIPAFDANLPANELIEFQAPFRPSTKPKTCITNTIRMTGIWSQRMVRTGHRHHSNEERTMCLNPRGRWWTVKVSGGIASHDSWP